MPWNKLLELEKVEKEEVKLLLFEGDMILYRETSKDSTKKLLELIKEFKSCMTQNQYTKVCCISMH